ncbi:hypothetical protein Cgig2_008922 [Carnegiea gigantea]|uniref:Uncharacterized protein n=1 Tax=Carnegiea gigantea TaxID=171969 RepID=A0A9Q1GLP8_9CARY|nr:hypothetical protein Cgig2_008922 [Carnegiea gigantea]
MVTKTIGGDLSEYKVWYILKYDRQVLMPFEGNIYVRMIFKGNDKHDYLYVRDNDGPRRHLRKGAAARKGRMHSCDDGVVCSISGRGEDIALQEGQNGGAKQGAVKRSVSETKQPQSRPRLEGETIEFPNDNEISMVSNDGCDEEVNESGNVWPQSGLQVQSYYCKLNIWKKLIKAVGHIFQLTEAFRQIICRYAIAK